MGFKSSELSPPAVTALTPSAKQVYCKAFQIARTDTTASVKAILPANATIIGISLFSPAVSDAATTATVSIGTTSSANELVNGANVKAAAGIIALATTAPSTYLQTDTTAPSTYLQTDTTALSDFFIYAKYAETGTASTAGGPYTVFISFVV